MLENNDKYFEVLKDINKPIGVSEYKILSEIPEFLENTLPSSEDIEKRLEEDFEWV